MKKAIKQSTLSNILSTLSLVLISITLAIFLLTITFYNQLGKARDDKFDLIYHANNFQSASEYLTSQVRAYVVTGDTEYYDNYWHEVNEAKRRDIAKDSMYAIGLTDEEKGYVDAMGGISNDLVPIEDEAMQLVASGRNERAQTLVYGGEYDTGVTEIDACMDKFFNSITIRTDDRIKSIGFTTNLFTVIAIVCIAIIALVQVVIILFVKKKLINTIISVKDSMVTLSQGNLSTKLNIDEDTSEVGTLAGAMNRTITFIGEIIVDVDHQLSEMASGNFRVKTACADNYIGDFKNILLATDKINRELSSALFEINIASDQVSAGSDQVSSAAQELSQGATEQASSIEELAVTIGEMTEKIRSNAENATDAEKMSTKTGVEILQSNEQMKQMVSAMENISESANEIGKIIKTIDDIAFQTNILALNAAVEAARAGVAGKGFAVVADEVRNLAGKSAEAASSTTALIEKAISAVQNGTHIADETAISLGTVVERVTKVNEYIKQIAAASEEQAEGAVQITHGSDRISAVVQTNSATAEESAAASQQLSAQANTLKSLVGKFKLSEDAAGISHTSPSAYFGA